MTKQEQISEMRKSINEGWEEFLRSLKGNKELDYFSRVRNRIKESEENLAIMNGYPKMIEFMSLEGDQIKLGYNVANKCSELEDLLAS